MSALAQGKDFIDVHFWYSARSRLIAHYLRCWRAEPILEIGAGSGVVLVALRAAGYAASGIDIAHYPNTLDPSIRYGQDALFLPEAERKRYQALALFDVLEHISDRVAFLEQLRTYFVNQKYLYLTVPARTELYGLDDERLGHFLRYMPEQLQNELEAAGYRVLYWRYWFHLLYWPLWMKVKQKKVRGPAVAPASKSPRRLLHRGLATYFYWEARLLPATWRGTSLFCVAQPNSVERG